MASGFFDPEFASLSAETPVSSFTNQCDTCGKTFAHSSSYRRHARTQCDSQTRKRRRKLWLPDESDRCDNVVPDKEDADDGVGPLLNTPECETEGNILFVCLLPFATRLNFRTKFTHEQITKSSLVLIFSSNRAMRSYIVVISHVSFAELSMAACRSFEILK